MSAGGARGGGAGAVLVVDDEQGFRDFFREVLSDAGYAVEAVATWPEAEERVGALEFGVVLLDGCLAGASGLEALRRLKALRPGLPVVVLSMMSEDLLEEARGLGAEACLPKPTEPDALVRLVERAVARPGEGRAGGGP